MSISPDSLTDSGFTVGGRATGSVTFLPEPERQPRKYTFISVDDHIVEPPDIFEGRLPKALQERAPRVVEDAQGRQHWEFEGKQYPNIGFNAVVFNCVLGESCVVRHNSVVEDVTLPALFHIPAAQSVHSETYLDKIPRITPDAAKFSESVVKMNNHFARAYKAIQNEL